MAFGARSIAAAMLLIAGLATTSAALAPSQAAAAAPHATTDDHHEVANRQFAPAQAAASPTTSPAPVHTYLCHPGHADCGALPGCPSGYACAYVYEGGSVEWEFQFYKYGTYTLYNWLGTGQLANHQTCGATFRTYGQAGQQLKSYAPRSAVYGVDWGPVYRISLNKGSC